MILLGIAIGSTLGAFVVGWDFEPFLASVLVAASQVEWW